MALINCKECGEKISKKAEACPKCGAKQPKRRGIIGWIGLIGFSGFIVYSCGIGQPPKTDIAQSKPPKVETPKDIALGNATMAAMRLKASMKDPSSFKVLQALMMDDLTACIEYTAKNSFGALTRSNAVLPNGGNKFITDNDPSFNALDKKLCANKSGSVFTVSLNSGL